MKPRDPSLSPPRPAPLRLALALALALAACDAEPAVAPAGALCETPWGPALDPVPAGATLAFATSGGASVRVGTGPVGATAPDAWRDDGLVPLPAADAPYALALFAELTDPRCAADAIAPVTMTLTVAPDFAPSAAAPDLAPIAAADPRVVAWATAVPAFRPGRDVDARWRDPAQALGPPGTDPLAVTTLGNGGSLTLAFARPLADGPGPDLAIFENALDADGFLELARVEVSTDGRAFAAFDAAYLGDAPIPAFGHQEARLLHGLAGKYPLGYGTPFDLALLRFHPAVQSGAVDLDLVRFVRVVDVIGDGRERDAFGRPIYDPTPTKGSGGFDLDAVAVLHEAP